MSSPVRCSWAFDGSGKKAYQAHIWSFIMSGAKWACTRLRYLLRDMWCKRNLSSFQSSLIWTVVWISWCIFNSRGEMNEKNMLVTRFLTKRRFSWKSPKFGADNRHLHASHCSATFQHFINEIVMFSRVLLIIETEQNELNIMTPQCINCIFFLRIGFFYVGNFPKLWKGKVCIVRRGLARIL